MSIVTGDHSPLAISTEGVLEFSERRNCKGISHQDFRLALGLCAIAAAGHELRDLRADEARGSRHGGGLGRLNQRRAPPLRLVD